MPTKETMKPPIQQDPGPQAVDAPRKTVARSRVKPRNLSQILRQAIVEEFQARQSSEDVAEELGLPVRTIDDVVKLYLMRMGPGTERGYAFPARRLA